MRAYDIPYKIFEATQEEDEEARVERIRIDQKETKGMKLVELETEEGGKSIDEEVKGRERNCTFVDDRESLWRNMRQAHRSSKKFRGGCRWTQNGWDWSFGETSFG